MGRDSRDTGEWPPHEGAATLKSHETPNLLMPRTPTQSVASIYGK